MARRTLGTDDNDDILREALLKRIRDAMEFAQLTERDEEFLESIERQVLSGRTELSEGQEEWLNGIEEKM